MEKIAGNHSNLSIISNNSETTNNTNSIVNSKKMVKQLKLCHTFRSMKPHRTPPNPTIEVVVKSTQNTNSSSSTTTSSKRQESESESEWCVYLIASTNPPFKTYVGVTTDFSRRLRQHNGEVKGGAKASRAGRPWLCACLVRGFTTRSLACQFESKWKNISRKMRREVGKVEEGVEEEETEKRLQLLLRHRYAAMEKLKDSFGFDHLRVDWQLSPF